jgi:hypothetical protein
MGMMLTAVVVAGSAALALAYASVLEWVVHRFGYHDAHVWRAATAAHRRHHEVLYTPERFYERGAYRTSQPWWLETAYVAAHVPALLALACVSAAAAVTAAVVIACYAAATHYVHPLTHRRTRRRHERSRIFKRLVARHVRHHRHPEGNYNLLLPLGDWLFGTRLSPERQM